MPLTERDWPWIDRMKRDNERMQKQIDDHHMLIGWDGTNGVNFDDHVKAILTERDQLRAELAEAHEALSALLATSTARAQQKEQGE